MPKVMENEIDDYIFHYCRGELTKSEQKALTNWIASSPENENYFRQKAQQLLRLQATGQWERLDETEARLWGKIRRVTLQSRKKRYLRLTGAAAAILLLGGLTGILYQSRHTVQPLPHPVGVLTAEAGSSKAILTVASGKQIPLGEGMQKEILKEKQLTIVQDSAGGLRYKTTDDLPEEQTTEENIITVPAGGEYYVILSDGTKVWLNSGSELKFPVRFNGTRREVTLRGEGYFEVTENPDMPFHVTTGQGEIEVLGTAFNLSAYPEDNREEIALLRGKISFCPVTGNKVVLTPGEIAVYRKAERSLTVMTGDVAAIVDWKTGRFNFVDMPLEELMVKLGRWYQVSFRFHDPDCRTLRFTGAVTKYRPLSYVLDMISKTTRVRFVNEGNQVIVYSKKKP